MKPDWDQLMADHADSKSLIVAEVDCTVEEEVCSSIGVRGYPTLKYWMAGESKGDAHDYQGARELSGLSEFVSENLQKMCSVSFFFSFFFQIL
jgi:thioredoxin-like negative regulator of GroEL